VCDGLLGIVPNCEVTAHASRRLEEHAKVLMSKGLSPQTLLDAIRRVCENPDSYDRSRGGIRFSCFCLGEFYIVIVYKLTSLYKTY